MKVNFPIIWIDDNEGFYDSLKDEIELHISDYGLQANIHFSENDDNLDNLLKKENPYILVLDYHLAGSKGDEIICNLRSKGHLHDILFYTQGGFSKANFQDFFDSTNSHLATGVHFCPKESTKERLYKLIDLKLSQVSDLSTQRGWIVADAIELEHQINAVLEKFGDHISPVFKATITRLLKSKRTDFGLKSSLLNGIIKDYINHLQKGDKNEEKIKKFKIIKKIIKNFSTEIIEIRNTIAHQKHRFVGDSILLSPIQSGQEDIIYDESFLKKVRNNIQIHYSNFNALEKLLRE